MSRSENIEAALAGATSSKNLNYEPNFNTFIYNPSIVCDLERECLAHMACNSIPCKDPLCVNGEIHRFSIDNNPAKRDEWYVAKSWDYKNKSYLQCAYGSWTSGSSFIFKSWENKDTGFSMDERAAFTQETKKIEDLAKSEKERRHSQAAKEAEEIWSLALKEPPLGGGHATYLQLKKIKSYGTRFGKNPQGYDSVIVPIFNAAGNLRSLQFISVGQSGDCFKMFLSGGEKKSCFFILGDLSITNLLYVSEGFATASSIYEAVGKPVAVAFDSGNLNSVIGALLERHPSLQIIIAADDDVDNSKNPGRKKAEEAAKKHACTVVFPKFSENYKLPNGKSGTDFNDVHVNFGLDEVKKQLHRKSHLTPVNIAEILSRDIPPKKMILKPWLREKDLAMLYAMRGIGKTWAALSIGYAIASGGKVLNFEALESHRILYLDGEMPASTIKERLIKIGLCSDVKIQNPNFFRIINRDLEDVPIRDLGTLAGQRDINELIDEFDVLILDNLSSLIQSGDENDASSWVIVQGWLLQLRKLGKTVVIIHHAGKNGQQRGTSKKEDILDTVIALKKPQGWTSSDGARFEVHYEKNRGFEGNDAKPFEAWLATNTEGVSQWTLRSVEDGRKEEAFALLDEGMTVTDIAKDLGVHKSTISRWVKSRSL